MYREGSPVRRSSGTPKTGFGSQFVHAITKQRWIPFYLSSLGPAFWGFKKQYQLLQQSPWRGCGIQWLLIFVCRRDSKLPPFLQQVAC